MVSYQRHVCSSDSRRHKVLILIVVDNGLVPDVDDAVKIINES